MTTILEGYVFDAEAFAQHQKLVWAKHLDNFKVRGALSLS